MSRILGVPACLWCCLIVLLALGEPGQRSELVAQEEKPSNQTAESSSNSSLAWTLDDALGQLQLYPRDPYLRYVAMQLARRDGQTDRAIAQLMPNRPWNPNPANERARGVDLFNLFSGALAVQESLQMESLGQRQRQAIGPGQPDANRTVLVSTLKGPTIQSHPWEKMLAGRKPEVSALARAVPEDFYFIEFQSLDKLLQVVERSDLWSTHVVNQSEHDARTQLVAERLKDQLAIQTSNLLRPVYDQVVRDLAITGSDLFLREGSDVTLLFRIKQPIPFRAQMDGFLTAAMQKFPDAKRTEGKHLDVPYVHLESADRKLHVFSAYPQPDLHVRSNSRAGLERVIEAIRGRDARGNAVKRLGDSTEFAYIRTLMPLGAAEEDGFVYLSDAFIRRMVGPQVKLAEQRRMVCYNHLRMIGHGGLMYLTQHGKSARSLDELAHSGCAPDLSGDHPWTCPDGGSYTLSADGLFGACSHHGHADALVPLSEIPIENVTATEAAEYEQFLREYNQYWRTFFDPIALRIKVTPERYQIETIVLPLIQNTIYAGLAQALGGEPEPLDSLPVPQRNIFSLAMRFNKQAIVRQMGLEGLLQPEAEQSQAAEDREGPSIASNRIAARRLFQIALGMHNYHDTFAKFPADVSYDRKGKKSGLSWRVHLLPFLEQAELYQQFKLDEPWDSEANKKLISRMPEIFQSGDPKLTAAGKTRFVTPIGKRFLFPDEKQQIRFANVTDGLSNTIMLLEADDKHAVVWTSPDDLPIDPKAPFAALYTRQPDMVYQARGDGTVGGIRRTMPANVMAAHLTRDGGEPPVDDSEFYVPVSVEGAHAGRGNPFGIDDAAIRSLQVGEFLVRGIGNQVALHIYDDEPTFSFGLTNFLGQVMGSFNGRNGFQGGGSLEVLAISTMVASLQAPVYVSVPVQDPAIVDRFLDNFDRFVSVQSRRESPFDGFFRVTQDFYRMDVDKGSAVRGYAFQLGPVKWRFFWSRIGNGLYIASRPFILDDLRRLQESESVTKRDQGPVGHVMLRLRPEHWDRVLADFDLGWAESNRTACLHNLGPLSSLARAAAAYAPEASVEDRLIQVRRFASAVYSSHHFCPDGGEYHVDDDGHSIRCTMHGTATDPHQPPATVSKSARLGKSLHELKDIVLSLKFLEDGLHATVIIDRK